MIIKNVSLDIVCGVTSVLPENAWPEIAFAGKSNVGKSSLIDLFFERYHRTLLQRQIRRSSLSQGYGFLY